MEKIRVCLSDLPKEKMRKGNNGKIYITLIVDVRKDPDQWGQNLKVYVDQSQEDRQKHCPKIYVGGGKTYNFSTEKGTSPTQEEQENLIPPTEKKKMIYRSKLYKSSPNGKTNNTVGVNFKK